MIICKNSDDARRYFTGKSMTYKDVSDGDIGVLFILLNKHVKQAIKAGVISTNTIRMSRKIKK
ncbi:hypothetical protein [Sporosarcina sp. FSL K6-1508]|uniref:hypothetical protein n=1 Tax=Sporosarcina sp. FSL K6-1508 TaxID=2921553 RepID=UPI0030F6B563